MILIKIGGGKSLNWDGIAKDIKKIPEKVVLVHGANGWMGEVTDKLGLSQKTIISPSGQTSRYTDEATMDVLTMVYSGLVNKKIVATLQRYGVNAVGLSGADGKMWLGKRKDTIFSQEGDKVKVIRDSLTGNVISINSSLIQLLSNSGYVPVITIPAITSGGELINVDNDRAVAVMVKDLKIQKVVMLFEAPGLLEDFRDEKSKITHIHKDQIDTYIKNTNGRMRKKLLGVKEAFSYGVQTVYLADGRIGSPVLSALQGKGTVIS